MSFLEQFKDLCNSEPRMATYNIKVAGSTYTNFLIESKKCHFCFNSGNLKNCAYVYSSNNCKNSVDLHNCEEAENCYECTDSSDIKNCRYLITCFSCTNCEFSEDLFNCEDCFGCVGLLSKKYHVFNKDYKTKAEYKRQVEKIHKTMTSTEINEKYDEIRNKTPKINMLTLDSTVAAGDFVYDSTIIYPGYNTTEVHYASYVEDSATGIFCVDINNCIHMHNCIDCTESSHLAQCQNCFFCAHSKNLLMCAHCFDCEDCIGCINLKNKKYCILNEQYTKDEYEKKAAEIKKELAQNSSYSIGKYFANF